MSASRPVKVIVASAVPSPTVKVKSPISPAFKLKTPFVTVICTSRIPVPSLTSMSEIESRLLLAALKMRRASSLTD